MHNSHKVVWGQIGRTFFKIQQQQQKQQFNLHIMQQQQQQYHTLLFLSNNPTSGNGLATGATGSQNTLDLPTPTPTNTRRRPILVASHYNNKHCSITHKGVNFPARFYSKFTAARESLPLGSYPLCEERALDLISNLKETELAAIKLALKKYEAQKQKENFEGKLAATQWRTRFGRPSKVPALGEVDPTGSFCPFPDDWLKKKAAEKAANPTSSDLWKIFFVNAVPFVGFGFLDNFTMIIAGDYIEYMFGTVMCISTMAAAGLGNTISDVIGIGSAYYIERGCELLGLKPPDLTPIQLEMKSSRRAANYGRIIGITVGCLLGMFPLLFIDRKAIEEERKAEDERKKQELKQKEADAHLEPEPPQQNTKQ